MPHSPCINSRSVSQVYLARPDVVQAFDNSGVLPPLGRLRLALVGNRSMRDAWMPGHVQLGPVRDPSEALKWPDVKELAQAATLLKQSVPDQADLPSSLRGMVRWPGVIDRLEPIALLPLLEHVPVNGHFSGVIERLDTIALVLEVFNPEWRKEIMPILLGAVFMDMSRWEEEFTHRFVTDGSSAASNVGEDGLGRERSSADEARRHVGALCEEYLDVFNVLVERHGPAGTGLLPIGFADAFKSSIKKLQGRYGGSVPLSSVSRRGYGGATAAAVGSIWVQPSGGVGTFEDDGAVSGRVMYKPAYEQIIRLLRWGYDGGSPSVSREMLHWQVKRWAEVKDSKYWHAKLDAAAQVGRPSVSVLAARDRSSEDEWDTPGFFALAS